MTKANDHLAGKNWTVVKNRPRYNFYLQWQNRLLWFDNDTMSVTEGKIADSKSFCYAFIDFPQDEGPQQIVVQGDVKYAHILGRRHAEQAGELGQDSIFHDYKIFKKSKNECELIYHIIPRSLLEKARTECSIPSGCVLMDWSGLLLGLIERGGRKTRAFALRGESSILVAVGNSSKVDLIRRYPFFSGGKDDLDNAASLIAHDLYICQQEKGADFNEIQWIEAFLTSKPVKLPVLGFSVSPWPLTGFVMDHHKVLSALPAVLKEINPRMALHGAGERYVRPMQKMEKWVWIFLLITAISLGFVNGMYNKLNEQLESQAVMLGQQMSELELVIEGYDYSLEGIDDVAGAMELVLDLRRSLVAPSVISIWNDFFESWPLSWELYDITLAYDDEKIIIETTGTALTTPDHAERQFWLFRQSLLRKGFEVKDVIVNFMAGKTEFTMDASYPWLIYESED